MNEDNYIEQAVEESLRSLDSLQKADPGPWFAAKVMRRWEEEKNANTKVSFWLKPSFQLAALGVLLLLNLTFVLNQQNSSTDDRSSLIQAFAQEYDLNTSAYQLYQ
ncbi:MAG: hypothetical protein AAFN10_00415 [Bacteroidota bacterium]